MIWYDFKNELLICSFLVGKWLITYPLGRKERHWASNTLSIYYALKLKIIIR